MIWIDANLLPGEYLLSRKDLGLKSAAENNHASRLLSRLLLDLV